MGILTDNSWIQSDGSLCL